MTAGGPNGAHGSAKPVSSMDGSPNGHGNGRSAPRYIEKRNGNSATMAAVTDRLAMAVAAESASSQFSPNEQFASFQTDAPACDNCGAITVRNGNCYLCYNCGSSMGCS